MNPAFSVIAFTVTAGLGQGLFVSLLLAPGWSVAARTVGGVVVVLLCVAGLVASFFHLGRPMRAWRAVAMWRTSWLSREVIVLPLFIAAAAGWTAAVASGAPGGARTVVAVAALVLCALLWWCTGMIYACLRFVQEWAHWLTIASFTAIGLASGFTLAAVLASFFGEADARMRAAIAAVATVVAAIVRLASLARNARLAPRSTVQSATGLHHPKVVQRAQGATGGSFNTREFFHGKSLAWVRHARQAALALGFAVPALLVAAAALAARADVGLALSLAALVVQYAGLLADRWVFFAQARHPQNLYYQAVS